MTANTKESGLHTNPLENDEEKPSKTIIGGIPIGIFALLLIAVVIAIYTESLPNNIAAGLAATVIVGGALYYVGDRLPGIGFFGGGSIFCIMIPALLLHFSLLPQSFGDMTAEFFNESGYSDVIVVGIVVGSLLGMKRSLLIKVGLRFVIPLLGGVLVAFLVAALLGALTGIGAADAMMFIAAPIMAGGIAAGVVPMADIYAANTGEANVGFIEQLTPMVLLANVVCIVIAGVLNGSGKKVRSNWFSGDGKMLRRNDTRLKTAKPSLKVTLESLLVGITLSGAVYCLALVLQTLLPGVHMYIWIILVVLALKLGNLVPKSLQRGAENWSSFVTYALTPSVLVALSAGIIDIEAVIQVSTDPRYLVTLLIVVLAGATGAGVAGLLVGFYFVESSISAGLGMADMGGAGDIAVLSASERMHLMPFLQIASRLGGLMMLVIAASLAPILL